MSEAATDFTPVFPDLSHVPSVDEVGVNERVARFQTRSIKTAAKLDALKLILSMIDLTTLEGQDTPGKVRQLCRKAVHLHDALPGLPHVAAVCVYPNMVGVAHEALAGSGIRIASVATAFPSGMSSLEVKLADSDDGLQVSFGDCELQVGEKADRNTSVLKEVAEEQEDRDSPVTVGDSGTSGL